MRTHKYKNGKTVYRIRRYFKNHFITGGYIEACIIVSRYINTPVQPWYYIKINEKTITEGEDALYSTEEEARQKLKEETEASLKRLDEMYKETKKAIKDGINSITTTDNQTNK